MHDLIRRAEAALTANPFSPQAGLIQDLLAALKAQQPAPIDAEGLLPEPVGVLHRGEGGEWSFSTGGHLRSLYAQPIGEHKLHTVDQLRRAQREAMAVERERWVPTVTLLKRSMALALTARSGMPISMHEAEPLAAEVVDAAIRQGASHD